VDVLIFKIYAQKGWFGELSSCLTFFPSFLVTAKKFGKLFFSKKERQDHKNKFKQHLFAIIP
jgi:hypothetical protein